jgi:hypothetical protein
LTTTAQTTEERLLTTAVEDNYDEKNVVELLPEI